MGCSTVMTVRSYPAREDVNSVGVLAAWEDLPVRPLADVLRLWPEPDLSGVPDADEILLLATVQPRTVWDELRFGNQLTQTWDRVDPDRMTAYRWMSAQMTARTGCPPGSAPLWLWARANTQTLMDDISWDPSDSVLLTVAIPAGRLVLSSHEGWHYVLNRAWCPAPNLDVPGRRSRTWPELLTFEDLPVSEQQRVETSWGWTLVPELWSPAAPVQAVTSLVSAPDVVSASRFALT